MGPLPAVLKEASGVAESHQHPGRLWVNNDGENPFIIFALDTLAHVQLRLRIDSAQSESDWEDIAVSRCGKADCIYLADIGNNYSARRALRILRFHEPDNAGDSVAEPATFPFRYPDGSHDAEALFVLPGERVFIITKGRSGPVALYSYPGRLRRDTVTLNHVRDLTPGLVQFPAMVTGAAASPDGNFVAVRTYGFIRLYKPTPAGDLEPLADSVPLKGAREFQGEGVTINGAGRVFLVGEKGFDTVPPALIRMVCQEEQQKAAQN